MNSKHPYSTSVAPSSGQSQNEPKVEISEEFKTQRLKNINRSMQLYLEKALASDEFMAKEIREFESGKRHLANMMSMDPDEMTQQDIDEAIKYLFPSGLFEKRARPMMQHPSTIYEKRKEAQFNIEGRPHHYLFFTTKPNFFETLHKVADQVEACNKYEDEKLKHGILDPPSTEKYFFSSRQWMGLNELRYFLLEDITDEDYNYLIRTLEFLKNHPYSNLSKELLDKFSEPRSGQSKTIVFPPLEKSEDGKTFVTFNSKVRELVLKVTTTFDGTGKIDIMGYDILYFDDLTQRESVLFPLQISGMLDKVDIKATIIKEPATIGHSQVAKAIRQAVALSIGNVVDEETRENMRISGLLTLEKRTRERKKFGQEGSRRKYTWKKR